MDEVGFRKQLEQEGYDKVAVVEWPAGIVNESHSHEFSAAIYVLSGELTLTRDGATETYRTGDDCRVAAGTAHTENTGPDGVKLLVGRK